MDGERVMLALFSAAVGWNLATATRAWRASPWTGYRGRIVHLLVTAAPVGAVLIQILRP